MTKRIFVVGGAVRDHLLGRPVKDHDFVVVGATEQDMLDDGFSRVGADFPVFLHPGSKDEYALARRERKTGPGYHGFECEFDPSVTLEDDLFRRDLTINAMAVDVDDWDKFVETSDRSLVVDPFGGLADLDAKRLHVVSDAFAEDPVRILRTARFQARYGFPQSRETSVAIMKMVKAGEVDNLVPERVWAEMVKAIVEENDPLDFFFFLDFHDCRKKLFKQLNLTDQLIANFDHVDNMDARHRMALLTTGFKNADQVAAFFDKLKAPVEFKMLAVRTHHLVKLSSGDLTPDAIVDTLTTTSAFQDADDTIDGLHVAAALDPDFVSDDFHSNVATIQSVLPDLLAVSFKDLTDDQQATLKGKEIGDALRDLRLNIVNEQIRRSNNKST